MQTVKQPTILIILGVTGDLTAKKIIPAIFHLYKKQVLAEQFAIVGFGRREFSGQNFKQFITEIIKEKIKDPGANLVAGFLEMLTYQQGLFEEQKSYENLGRTLDAIQKPWGQKTNRLFYLAVPPTLYQIIFQNLKLSGLSDRPGNSAVETRILVEKPFGSNLKSAESLDELLGSLFTEDKIYRIDHYLAKEMVQNILTFRFSNDLFEKTWSNKFIEQIEIKLWETLGVEHRGAFYDEVGALRDVGQNHLLQMLALVTMEYPLDFNPKALHLRRAQILKKLTPLTKTQIRTSTFRAQYKGYNKIIGVAPNSQTETFFKIKTELADKRWKGTPIYLEGGKRLDEQRKELVVTYRHPQNCLCPPGNIHYKNRIIFTLEPAEGIIIEFWSKKPGLSMQLEKRTINFSLRSLDERLQYIEEYEKLLLDCILGDQTLFVSTNEVRSMWKFIDPIVEEWQNNAVPLFKYIPDSDQAIQQSMIL